MTERSLRLLVVVTHDFGEMGLALDFLKEEAVARQSLLLLPSPLYEANRRALPVSAAAYASLDEAGQTAERLQPAVILLLSGYLLVPNGLATHKALRRWSRAWRRQGIRILTSDPFLGLCAKMRPSDVAPDLVWQRPGKRRLDGILAALAVPLLQRQASRQFRRTARLLAGIPTLSPVPLSRPPTSQSAPWQCFRPPNSIPVPGHGEAPGPPSWVFILSALDYRYCLQEKGREAFIQLLRGLAESAWREERLPVFILPPDGQSALKHMLPEGPPAQLHSNCRYGDFTSLLLRAEHAFYWNRVSYSILVRLRAGKAFHFFAQGHTARMFPSLHQCAMETYFPDTEVDLLDPASPLRKGDLETRAARLLGQMRPLLEALQAAPLPSALLQALTAPDEPAESNLP